MVIVFKDSAESTDILAEILIAGVAGITGFRADVLGKVVSVSELAQCLGCTIPTFFPAGLPVPQVTYIYDSSRYSLEDVRLMVEAAVIPPVS